MLYARLLTAAVAIPLLLALVFAAPAWLFAAVVAFFAVLGVGEYAVMAFPGRARERWGTVVLGVIVVVGAGWGQGPLVPAALAVAIAGGLIWIILVREDFQAGLRDLGLALVGVLFSGFLLPHFIWMRELVSGPRWIAFLLTVAMAGDSLGYFVGKRLGRRKLAPRLSPGKTVEGSAGILAGSLLGALAAHAVLLPLRPTGEAVVLGLVMGTVGQLGDLCESAMKRSFDSKESGWIFPGHGGLLDRIDSLLFPVVVLYYYLLLAQ